MAIACRVELEGRTGEAVWVQFSCRLCDRGTAVHLKRHEIAKVLTGWLIKHTHEARSGRSN